MKTEDPLIKEAYHFARMKHRGQKHPFSQRSQFDHVVKVYFQVYRFTRDVDIRVAALLLDTLRYSRCRYDEIARRFSINIADWVKEISWKEEDARGDGHGRPSVGGCTDAQEPTYPRIFLPGRQRRSLPVETDISVVSSFESCPTERERFFRAILTKASPESAMILLADRLEEMNYLEALDAEKRKRYIMESEWIIASLPQPWNTEHGFIIEELREKQQKVNTLN